MYLYIYEIYTHTYSYNSWVLKASSLKGYVYICIIKKDANQLRQGFLYWLCDKYVCKMSLSEILHVCREKGSSKH